MMAAPPFPDRKRVDAREKVTGTIRYAADVPLPGLLYAMTVPATVAKGRMTALLIDAALRVPGVVRVLTPEDFPPPAPAPNPAVGSDGGELAPPPPTLERRIAYRGQPVALVVAETLEAAIQGAEAVDATFTRENFSPLIGSEPEMRTAPWVARSRPSRPTMTRPRSITIPSS